jgi:hypothetical protein
MAALTFKTIENPSTQKDFINIDVDIENVGDKIIIVIKIAGKPPIVYRK